MKNILRKLLVLALLATCAWPAFCSEGTSGTEQKTGFVMNLSNPTDLRGIVKQYIHANFPNEALSSLARNSRPEPPKPGALETAAQKNGLMKCIQTGVIGMKILQIRGSRTIEALCPDTQAAILSTPENMLVNYRLKSEHGVEFEEIDDDIEIVCSNKDGLSILVGSNTTNDNGEDLGIITVVGPSNTIIEEQPGGITALAQFDEASKIASGHEVGAITLYNNNDDFQGTSGITENNYPERSPLISKLAFTPSGESLVSASHAGSVEIWSTETCDAETLKCVHRFPHESPVTALSVGSDNRHVISGTEMGAVSVLDIISGKIVRTRRFSDSEITALALSPDHKYALFCTRINEQEIAICFFDPMNGKILLKIPYIDGTCTGIEISSDSRTVLVSFSTNEIYKFKMPNLKSSKAKALYGGLSELIFDFDSLPIETRELRLQKLKSMNKNYRHHSTSMHHSVLASLNSVAFALTTLRTLQANERDFTELYNDAMTVGPQLQNQQTQNQPPVRTSKRGTTNTKHSQERKRAKKDNQDPDGNCLLCHEKLN